jgi:hypothetical protein
MTWPNQRFERPGQGLPYHDRGMRAAGRSTAARYAF